MLMMMSQVWGYLPDDRARPDGSGRAGLPEEREVSAQRRGQKPGGGEFQARPQEDGGIQAHWRPMPSGARILLMGARLKPFCSFRKPLDPKLI